MLRTYYGKLQKWPNLRRKSGAAVNLYRNHIVCYRNDEKWGAVRCFRNNLVSFLYNAIGIMEAIKLNRGPLCKVRKTHNAPTLCWYRYPFQVDLGWCSTNIDVHCPMTMLALGNCLTNPGHGHKYVKQEKSIAKWTHWPL